MGTPCFGHRAKLSACTAGQAQTSVHQKML
jgi:hypothetical protein